MSGTGRSGTPPAVRGAVRELQDQDRAWLAKILITHWGSTRLASRGRLHDGLALAGAVALREDAPSGVVLWREEPGALEVVLLQALVPGEGTGTALLDAARSHARRIGARRLWLVTTNDNLPAIAFYERRGLRVAAFHRGSARELRALKPEIPLVGLEGRPIEDEIEFEERIGERPEGGE